MNCYCTKSMTCDFCNGYRSPFAPELFCPRAMKEVASKMGITKAELAKLPADYVRDRVDLSHLRAEFESRYPDSVQSNKKQGRWPSDEDIERSDLRRAFHDGRLLLHIDRGRASKDYLQASHLGDTKVDLVHVISRPARGEIVGYFVLPDGSLQVRLPNYGEYGDAMESVVSELLSNTDSSNNEA